MNETTFAGFSEAAQLYAKYVTVVEEMRKRYEEDVAEYLACVTSTVESLTAPRKLHEEITDRSRWRYWWVADDEKPLQEHAYLWVDNKSPRIVRERKLHVTANVRRPLCSYRGQMRSVIDEMAVPSRFTLAKTEQGGLFTMAIPLEDDGVSRAAEVIADVLIALMDRERSLCP